jgi:bifunctional UDP-N-acetylglucosamine pyrophosphorylase/glucosamine-1-phosphate N-acetyltransferase
MEDTKPSADKVALILAAGEGKRMKSDLPKVLHKLNDRHIVQYVMDAAREAGLHRQLMVIGHRAESVREAFKNSTVEFVLQTEQLGTGHAVMMAEPLLRDFSGDLVVLCGDMPLVKSGTIKRLIEKRHSLGAAAVVLTVVLDDPDSYGRIVRDDNGLLKGIVEYRDADKKTRAVGEVNTGAYCFDWKELRPILAHLGNDNYQKEYYLTDSIAILVSKGKRVGAVVAGDQSEGMGVNSLEELKEMERLIKSGTTKAELL